MLYHDWNTDYRRWFKDVSSSYIKQNKKNFLHLALSFLKDICIQDHVLYIEGPFCILQEFQMMQYYTFIATSFTSEDLALQLNHFGVSPYILFLLNATFV